MSPAGRRVAALLAIATFVVVALAWGLGARDARERGAVAASGAQHADAA